jgi:hypothetical protein
MRHDCPLKFWSEPQTHAFLEIFLKRVGKNEHLRETGMLIAHERIQMHAQAHKSA